ncbi:MAG TPA: membrane protein insertase YidC [Candidatus Parcubacteria bacterium]|nr:membrane protein insertase YidC [Candidatus Parcubacteria bacterium]
MTSFFTNAFNVILYQPLLNSLILLYEYLPGHDFGVAVIVLTLAIRLILHPLSLKSIKSQKALSSLQPKIKEIQEKYKNNKEEQAKQLMVLYKEKKINPFSGCLPLLIQLPILIALYRVFWVGFQEIKTNLLYGFVANPGTINTSFLGIIDLAEPNVVLAVLAGVLQFFQARMIFSQETGKSKKGDKKQNIAAQMQKQTQYLMPVFTVIILFRLPAAIGLYWVVTTLFTIVQQYFIFKKTTNISSKNESKQFVRNK